jgi:hypothetical protein
MPGLAVVEPETSEDARSGDGPGHEVGTTTASTTGAAPAADRRHSLRPADRGGHHPANGRTGQSSRCQGPPREAQPLGDLACMTQLTTADSGEQPPYHRTSAAEILGHMHPRV